jgi:hypothetical protein
VRKITPAEEYAMHHVPNAVGVIYRGSPIGQFPKWKWHEDESYFLRLKEIVVTQNSQGKIIANPVYAWRVMIVRHPGAAEVYIRFGHNYLLSVVGKHPYFEVIKNDRESTFRYYSLFRRQRRDDARRMSHVCQRKSSDLWLRLHPYQSHSG